MPINNLLLNSLIFQELLKVGAGSIRMENRRVCMKSHFCAGLLREKRTLKQKRRPSDRLSNFYR